MRKIVFSAAAAILVVAGAAEPTSAKKSSKTWQVTRVTDPITGAHTCVVAAYDRAVGMSFSRVGYLYPVVEKNPHYGLLVGVSTGGRIRVPSGDILWRVDTNAHRELKAADNPAPSNTLPNAPSNAPDTASRAMQDAMAVSAKFMVAATSTSTVASGELAREMLSEMLTGRALIFRAAGAAPAYGLPSTRTVAVGQATRKGLKPIPLDESFHRGLSECDISVAGAAPEMQQR